MKLVIVESPTKAKTIGRFLGNAFRVYASMGHVRDLPKSKIGIDTKNNFEPQYLIPVKAKPVVAELQKEAAEAEEIILATDEDREGEAIAWHLAQTLEVDRESKPAKRKSSRKQAKSEKPMGHSKPVSRIVFHEITESAIKDALQHPRQLDMNLVDAQQARRILDRLVGYELSPFLWRKIRYGLSAGRVQSVALRLVVEREREIQNFKAEEYWTLEADFQTEEKELFRARLLAINGKNLDKFEINSEKSAESVRRDLENAQYKVSQVASKEVQRHPAPPFTTSTLQQEAGRKLGMTAKETMRHAQVLYENGFITYMRTDSVNLASSALSEIRTLINKDYGREYLPESPRFYTTKSKGAQEAHEAIRPTHVMTMKAGSGRGEQALYNLIWKRTMACQMSSARMMQTSADILASTQHTFRATGQTTLFDGFIRAYTEGRDDAPTGGGTNGANSEDENKNLPKLAEGQNVSLEQLDTLQHFTEPPARYTDPTLIKTLEQNGIGRPSTYAPTLSTIQDRGYVEREDRKYKPTEIGFIVNDLLVEHFPEIVDVNFTSHIEEALDEVAEGQKNWTDVCREFYTPFKEHLTEKEAEVEKQIQISETPCPHCGEKMLIKFGRMGKFLACPEPGVKVTLPMPEEQAEINALTAKTRDERCPLCGKEMTVRRSRFGYFLSCTNYPTCKGIAKIWNKTGFKCPACLESSERKNRPGDVVERKSRGRGRKVFYGCNRWPECNFITNKKPESEAELAEALAAWKAKPTTETKKKFSKVKKPEK